MAEKETKEVVLTEEGVSKYLESTDADAVADKLNELIASISTLVDRIQDLIDEDQMLSAIGAVSFSAVLTVVDRPQVVTMIGADKSVVIGLRELSNHFKELYMNKKEQADND